MSEWYLRCLDVSEGQVRTCQGRIGNISTGQVRTGQVRKGQVSTGQVSTGQVRAVQARTVQVKEGQDRTGEVVTGQVQIGKVRKGQVRTGHVRKNKNNLRVTKTQIHPQDKLKKQQKNGHELANISCNCWYMKHHLPEEIFVSGKGSVLWLN